MKGLFLIWCFVLMVLPMKAQHKAIVVFYSQNGSTEAVARQIQEQTGADLLELQAEQPYPDTYAATVTRVRKEQKDNVLPNLRPYTFSAKNYKTIYLGFPVWFGQPALPMQRFLKDNDLHGIRIVPFCSYGLGGMKSCVEWIRKNYPKVKVEPSYGISRYRLSAAAKEVAGFLEKGTQAPRDGGYGKYRALTPEDQEVFRQAMSTRKYRINYTPLTVSTQMVAGMNYRFQCEGVNSKGEKKPYEIKIFRPLDGEGNPEVIYIEGGDQE